MADDDPKPRLLRLLTDEEFARLGPGHRALYNHLRQRYGLLPISEPAVDSNPPLTPPPAPKLFDQPTLLQCTLAVEGGEYNLKAYQEYLAQTKSLLDAYDGDRRLLEERLCEGTATPEEIRFAGTHRKRPAHREKTLRRQIAEFAARRSLDLWEHWQPQQERGLLRVVLGKITDTLDISRRAALRMLQRIRKREK